ncbi:RNase adapter RapZ [Erysipelotrichaceae bacterium OttesenSCG-928-M19]|nr:RNase adapter RapZ [Erysipelotrichaceae bacterium OttesenSCG-928-M19]
MEKRELILVCGISGAGKTVTMNYLDSAGYYCIDNLPVAALMDTVKALKVEEYFFNYAIAINSNTSEDIISNVLTKLRALEWLDVKMLFLDVSNEEVLNRFQLTRKQHPFSNQNETLVEAINQERKLLTILRQYANIIIDTTELDDEKLKRNLSQMFDRDIVPQFRLCFVSFGYKYGLPNDLDFVFDVRFIKNPYYIEELKDKTGNDQEVYDYVFDQEETTEFINKLLPLLDYSIEKHHKTKRSYLVIGVGCTGGKHRSVSIVNYLAQKYHESYLVIKDHRDVEN